VTGFCKKIWYYYKILLDSYPVKLHLHFHPFSHFVANPKFIFSSLFNLMKQKLQELKMGANKLTRATISLGIYKIFSLLLMQFSSQKWRNLSWGYVSINGCRRAQRLHFILCNSQRRVIASLTLWPWSLLKWVSKKQQHVSRGELSNGFPVVHCPWVLPSQQVTMVMPYSFASL
jgi:hypothetical protein